MRRSLRILPLILILLATCYTLPAQLSGGYTINSGAAASATNYQNFTSAVNDMMSGTRTDGGTPNGPNISAAVTFTVSAATYSESIIMTQITGATATNTITFDGVDPATRILTSQATSSGQSTWHISGADHVRIRNLGIRNTGTSDGFGIMINNVANNIEVTGCDVQVSATGTASDQVGIIVGTSISSYFLHGENITIQNNSFSGGYAGFVASGPSGTQAGNFTIEDNTFDNHYYTSMRLNYLKNFVVDNNDIDLRQQYNFAYGIYTRYCSEYVISNNIVNNCGAYGMYLYYSNYNTLNESDIYNNMINGEFRTTSTAYGVYSWNSRSLNIYHNSFLVDNPGSSTYGFYASGTNTTDLDIVNNSFAANNPNASNSFAIYLNGTNYHDTLDNNNYYSATSTIARMSSVAFSDLLSWQTAYPGTNTTSRVGWPGYVSASDIHAVGPALNNWAVNWAGYTLSSDVDGQSRPLPPDLTKDVGADEFNVPPVDLDLVSFVSPNVLSLGNNTIEVVLQNNGTNSLNGQTVSLQYSTDGGLTYPVTEVFTPTNLGTAGNSENYTFTTPFNVVTAGTYTICVRINPQVAGDPDISDDICTTVCSGMAGNYTINPALPTGGTNYNSFADAVSNLNSCGINGPVFFDIAPGTYNETVDLATVVGSSATNTITFDGGAPGLVNISFSFTSTNNGVVHLDGTDYVRFRNMTISAPGTYGYGIWLQNNADHNEFDNIDINLPTTSLSAYHIGVLMSGQFYYSAGTPGSYNTFDSLNVVGGYYGVRMNGLSTSGFIDENHVTNSTFREFYYYGIYCRYMTNSIIHNNLIRGRTNATASGYGMYMYYHEGNFEVTENVIHNVGARGIYMFYGNSLNQGRGRIVNNMIGAKFTGSTTTKYGMYLYNIRDTDVYHNSVDLGPQNGYALYMSGSGFDSLRVLNNIFASTSPFGSQGQAMYVSSSSVNGIQMMDHNNLYTAGGTLANFGGSTYSNLTTLQAAYLAFNQNSVNADPGFIADTNLHMVCSTIDNLGTPVTSVTTDLDGDSRSTTAPDIGADEFTSIVITYDLGNDTTNCDQHVIYADTNNYVGFIWGAGQTLPYLNVDSTDTYYVTVIDSNNCRASDSITVTIYDLPILPFNNDTISQCSADSIDALNVGSSYSWNTGDSTQIIVPPGSGTFSVDITTPDGCTLTDQITINLFANAVAQLGPDTTFCLGGSATLNGGTAPLGTVYDWSTGASSQILVVSAPGMYTLTVTSPNGCAATDSIMLNAVQPPIVELGPDYTACDSFSLSPGMSGMVYQWSTGSSNPSISGNTSGVYSVTVTDANGCSDVDQINVTVSATPNVNLGPDQVICANSSVTLDAGFPGFGYQWSTGANTQTTIVTQAGSYLVEVTDPGSGCVGMDSINVNASFISVNLGPDFSLCSGTSAVLDAGTGPAAYLWSNGTINQTLVVNGPGTYSVQVADGFGCVDSDDIVVSTSPLPQVGFTGAGTVNMLQAVNFTDQSAAGMVSYFWDFGDGNTSSAQNPTHAYQAMGTFDVCLTVYDGQCENTTCQQVTVAAPVGVADELFAEGVQVYPNPNNGAFSLNFDLPKALDLHVELFSLTGQKLYDQQLRAVRVQQEEVDIQGAAAGMYFLKITSDQGNEMIRKIVVE